MSDPQKPGKRDAWDLVQDALLEDELERIGTLTPEQLAEEARKAGIDPEAARREAEEAVRKLQPAKAPAPPPEKGEVVSLADARARKRPRTVLFASLAIAAGVLLVIGVSYKRIEGQIDAWLRPAPTEQPTETPQNPVPPTHEPTPLEKAAALREMALVNVAKGYMGDALDELDEAVELDPDSNTLPEVIAARKTIADKKPKPPASKPQLAPWEKPLPKRIWR